MIIFPAIDLKDGKVVRLLQGRFDRVTHYEKDYLTVAKEWEAAGARWLHVVDLDGAKTGVMHNRDAILKIAKAVKIPIQAGGGLRDEAAIDSLLENGVTRVILGTRAIEDPEFRKKVFQRWDHKIGVSLDCTDGFVAEHGWTQTSNLKAVDLSKTLEEEGLKTLIYTDVRHDGALKVPNYEGIAQMLKASNISLIVSGGISNLEDVKKLRTLEANGLIGMIVGKAIYEGQLDLNEAVKFCQAPITSTSATS